MPYHP
jgi:hypothetical protein